MKVEVIQYMRPNGRKVLQTIEIDDKCEETYKAILGCDARLTAEQMMTGMVSQTIEGPDGDYDFAITKGSNFDENKAVLEAMILRFDKAKFEEWSEQFQEAAQ